MVCRFRVFTQLVDCSSHMTKLDRIIQQLASEIKSRLQFLTPAEAKTVLEAIAEGARETIEEMEGST